MYRIHLYYLTILRVLSRYNINTIISIISVNGETQSIAHRGSLIFVCEPRNWKTNDLTPQFSSEKVA